MKLNFLQAIDFPDASGALVRYEIGEHDVNDVRTARIALREKWAVEITAEDPVTEVTDTEPRAKKWRK